MSDCKCRWDGNLDGKLLRCKDHADQVRQERSGRKALSDDEKGILTDILREKSLQIKDLLKYQGVWWDEIKNDRRRTKHETALANIESILRKLGLE